MKFVILKDHVKGCNALRNVESGTRWGRWDHPWGVIEKPYTSGAYDHPKRRGSRQWFVVGCNSTECDAKLAVRFDDIMKLAPRRKK